MKNPALCVCCHECKSCFMAVAMDEGTMDDKLWIEIIGYVLDGAIIDVRECNAINFKYCDCRKVKAVEVIQNINSEI